MQEFLEREWDDPGSRTNRTAKHLADQVEYGNADCVAAAKAFASQEPPKKYDALLDQTSDLAVSWHPR